MNRVSDLTVGAAVALLVSSSALAGVVDLGGNWQAEWDASLDPFVDVVSLGIQPTPDGDALFIEKSAEFTQGSVGGVFPSIPIVFRQTGPSNVEFIVIDDEIITNSTGEDWFDFHMQLVDGNDAFFDPARTAASGGSGPIGWTIDPFTQASFSPDNRQLDISGGVLPDGSVWFPGDGATNGQLWIDVNSAPADPFTVFTLKETPTIPAPAGLAVLAIGALGRRRRRRG